MVSELRCYFIVIIIIREKEKKMKGIPRVGMIGAGFMGGAHSQCIIASGRGKLEVAYSRSEKKARALAEKYGYKRWTTDWKEVINDPNVDILDIVSPNYTHVNICVAAAEAGKDFIIEKPLARTVKEADIIINAVKKSGVKSFYAEDLRYAPNYLEAAKIIEQGGVGDVFMMRTNEMHNGPFHSDWFWDAELAGGGVMIDVGIHGLYCIEWLMNAKVVEVYAKTACLKWKELCKNGAEDNAWAIWTFENGNVAETVFSWAIAGGMDTRLEIFGTKGSIYIDSARNSSGTVVFSEEGYGEDISKQKSERPHVSPVKGWHFPTIDVWNAHGHAQELSDFLSVWMDDSKKPLTTMEEGRRALELVEAGYESARTGKVVKLIK